MLLVGRVWLCSWCQLIISAMRRLWMFAVAIAVWTSFVERSIGVDWLLSVLRNVSSMIGIPFLPPK